MILKKNNKGFTLAELLIVVAIIAVLVAIAIPVFTSQLEKSRDSVTVAHVRSAYAEAMSAYLTGTGDGTHVTVTKPDGKITSIVVNDVVGKGQQAGLSDLDAELPGKTTGVTWTLTTLENAAGKKCALTFEYENDALKSVTAGEVS